MRPLPDNPGWAFPADGSMPSVRSVKRGASSYWLFTGVVTGPINELRDEQADQLSDWGDFFEYSSSNRPITAGIEAAGPPDSSSPDGRFSYVIPGISNHGPDFGSGFSVTANGQLNYGIDMSYETPVKWHSLDVTVHLEMLISLEGFRLDSVSPPADKTTPSGLAWNKGSAQGFSVDGVNLSTESSAQQRIFFAGILIALSGSALLAAFQERPRNLDSAARIRSAVRPRRIRARSKGRARSHKGVKRAKVHRYPAWTRAGGFLAAAWLITISPVWNFELGAVPLVSSLVLLFIIILLGVVFTTIFEISFGGIARKFPRYRSAFKAGYTFVIELDNKSSRRRQLRVWMAILYCLFFVTTIASHFYGLYVPPIPKILFMTEMAIIFTVLLRLT